MLFDSLFAWIFNSFSLKLHYNEKKSVFLTKKSKKNNKNKKRSHKQIGLLLIASKNKWMLHD